MAYIVYTCGVLACAEVAAAAVAGAGVLVYDVSSETGLERVTSVIDTSLVTPWLLYSNDPLLRETAPYRC